MSYRRILRSAEEDSDIVGLILGGSRGKGLQTKYSDYDIYLIAKDGRSVACKQKYQSLEKDEFVDLVIMDVSEFREYASFGGPRSWDEYNFAHLKAQLDKTGEIQKLMDSKSRIPPTKVRQFVEGSLDAYVNFVYRSLKCSRDGNSFGSRLEAA